jgi:phosphohistidine phosphatase
VLTSKTLLLVRHAKFSWKNVDLDDIVVEDKLYGVAPPELLDIISDFDDRLSAAMIALHNPSITELANMFSTESIENVPTCGVLVVESTAWSCLETARLMDFDYPKNLT